MLFLLAQPDLFTWRKLSSRTGDLPAPGPSQQQTGTIVGDFDGNGLADFMITARKLAPSVVWRRRTATGWDRCVVDGGLPAVEGGSTAADIGHGDLDILAGGGRRAVAPARHHAWREGQHHHLLTGDFESDCRLDLAFWNQGGMKKSRTCSKLSRGRRPRAHSRPGTTPGSRT